MLRWLLAFALAAFVPAVGADAQAPRQLDRAKVEAFVDGAVRTAMRANHIAGVSVAVVDGSGVVLARGYGNYGFLPTRKTDADTLFRVGSISKTPVWIAVMQLIEAGKLSLDDPINDHLPPSLRIPDEGFSKPILVRHLMTHTAGFEDSIEGLFVHDPAELLPLDDYLARRRVHRVREPGTLAVYSNYGAALAGALVAHVAGEPWQDYAETHILRPLGMKTATYREPYSAELAASRGLAAPMPGDVAANTSSGFASATGEFRTQAFEYISNLAPAGAMSASANDMTAYMQALLDPQRMANAGVLKAETALALREPLFANTPELPSLLHGFFDLRAQRGHRGFGHQGSLVSQKATMEIYPEEGFAIFLAVNTPDGASLLDALPEAFLDAFFARKTAWPARAKDAPAEAAKVVGLYRSLRAPTYRSEAWTVRYFNTFPVRAAPSGNIIIGGEERFRPIGDGVFTGLDGRGRVAFRERDGEMMMFDSSSVFPSRRIGFFESGRWLRTIAGAAAAFGAFAIVAAAERFFRRDRRGRAAAVLDALSLLWLVGGVLFVLAVRPWIADQTTFLFVYPGRLYPAALWALLTAAIATPVAALVAFGPLRPSGWGWWLWSRNALTLLVYAALIATLANWRLLGFSE